MRQQLALSILFICAATAGVIAACSDSSGPSRAFCTGSTPDLAGTWTLVSIVIEATGNPIPGPPLGPATGLFTFSGTTVNTDLHIPAPPLQQAVDIVGTGKCTLTADSIFIANFGVFGDAAGTYQFYSKGATGADTLKATLAAQGVDNDVVVAR